MLPAAVRFILAMSAVIGIVVGLDKLIAWLRSRK
jgi:hypothetical protein